MKQQETEVFHKLRVATPLSSRTGHPVSVVFNGVSANSWLSPIGISNNRKSEDRGDHHVLPQRPQSTGSIAIIRHHPRPSGLKRNETIVGRHLVGKGEEIDIHSIEGGHAATDAFRRPVPFEGDYREAVGSLLYKQRLVKKGYRGGGFCDGHAKKPRPYTSRPYQFRTAEQPISLELTVKSLELSRDRHSDAKRNRFPEEELERREHQSRNVDAFRDLSRTCIRRAQSAPPASRENPGKQKPSLYWRARSAYHRKLMTPQPDPECDPAESSQVVRGSMLRPLMYNGSTDIQHSAGCPYKCKGCFKACLVSADYLENARNRRQPVKATRDFRYRSLMKKDPRFILHQALARNQPIYKLVHGYCDEQSVQEAWDDGATIRGHTDDSDNLTQLSVLGDNGASTNCDTREDLTFEYDDTSSRNYPTVEDEDADANFLQPRTLGTRDSKPVYQPEDPRREEAPGEQDDKGKQTLFSRDGAKSEELRRSESLIKLNARSKSFSEAEKISNSILKCDTDLMDNLQEECIIAMSSKEDAFENKSTEDGLSHSCTPEHDIEVRAQECESICDSISDVNSAIMDISRLFCSSASSGNMKMRDFESLKHGSSSEGNRTSETGSDDSQETLHGDSGESGDYNSVESDTVSNSVETLNDNSVQSDFTNSEAPAKGYRRNNRYRKRTGSSIKSANKEAVSTSESVTSETSSGRSDSLLDVSDISDEPDTDSTIPERQRKQKPVGRKKRDTKRKPSTGKNRRVPADEGKRQLKSVKSVDSDMVSGTAHSATESELNFSENSSEQLYNSACSEGEETLVEQSDSTVHAKESAGKDHSKRTRTRTVKKHSRNPVQQNVKGKSSKVDEKASGSSASEESSDEEEDERDSKGDASEEEIPNRKSGLKKSGREAQVSRTSTEDTNSEDTHMESTESSGDDTSVQSAENKRKTSNASRKAQTLKKQTNKNLKSRKCKVIPTKNNNTKSRKQTKGGKEETQESDEESCDSEDDDDLNKTNEEINGNPKNNTKNNRKSNNVNSNTVEKVRSTRNSNKRGQLKRNQRIEHNSQSESVQSEEETPGDDNSSECSSKVSRGADTLGKGGSDDPEQRDTTDESDTGKKSDKSVSASETVDDASNTEQSDDKSDEESSDGASESENETDDG